MLCLIFKKITPTQQFKLAQLHLTLLYFNFNFSS